MEGCWKTTRWENRVFAFFLAIVEVNAYLGRIYFGRENEPQLDFKKKLCFELITYWDDVRNQASVGSPESDIRWTTRSKSSHRLIKAPHFCKLQENGRNV